jgi:hypothetical protein
MEELKKDTEDGKNYKLYRDVWKKFKVIDDVDDLTQDEMLLLNKFNFVPFKDVPVPKYKDGFITFYIIDDMIGTNIFKNGKSPFTNLCIRNRHVTPSNIIIATQAINMVPKTIRLNANLIVLFKFANKEKVIEDVFPIISAYANEKQLTELYDYATAEAHDSLVIDGTNGKIQFKKNFDKLLSFNNDVAS